MAESDSGETWKRNWKNRELHIDPISMNAQAERVNTSPVNVKLFCLKLINQNAAQSSHTRLQKRAARKRKMKRIFRNFS